MYDVRPSLQPKVEAMGDSSDVLLWTGRCALFLLLMIAVAANGLALIALWCRPAVRSPSNRFVVSLLLVNLVGCGALVPLHLLDTTSDGSKRPIICALGEAVASSFCAASILSVLLIVADQYRAVSSPLHFHRPSAAFDGGAAICLVWLVTALIGAGGVISSPDQGSLWIACGAAVRSRHGIRVAFAAVFAVVVLAVPLAALGWLYTAICEAARANEARARRCSTVSSSGVANGASCNGSNSVPVPVPVPVPSISGGAPEHVSREAEDGDCERRAEEVEEEEPEAGAQTRRPSCPLSARFRRRMSLTIEARAARVSAAVAAMALICWTPYSVVLALHAAAPATLPPRLADQLAFAALAASAIISPWLFAYRNRQLRLEIIAVPRRMSRFQVLASQV